MPREISFGRFSRSQQEIEGTVEGRLKKEKAAKERAAEKRVPSVQKLYSPEEEKTMAEGLVPESSVLKKYEAYEEPFEKEIIGKDRLEELEQEDKELDARINKDKGTSRGHRKGYKPEKVSRETIRENREAA